MTNVETRLREMAASATLTPDDQRQLAALDSFDPTLSRSSKTTPWKRPRDIAGALAGALILIVVMNTVAVYFIPIYGRILAGTPGIGEISGRYLSVVGLSSSDVTVVGDKATSAGHTVKLVGAYADGLRMVLFISIDGKGLTGNPKQYGTKAGDWGVNENYMSLTDQFGHSYSGWGVSGPTDLQFQPLAWPATVAGGRLTLHIGGLWQMWHAADNGPGVIDTEALTVHGTWDLHVTLVSKRVDRLPLPAAVRAEGATYTFTSITAAERTLIVHVVITGPVTSRPLTPDADLDVFRPTIYDAAGEQMRLQDFGVEMPMHPGGPMKGEVTAFIVGPGGYRIVIAGQDRWITVP